MNLLEQLLEDAKDDLTKERKKRNPSQIKLIELSDRIGYLTDMIFDLHGIKADKSKPYNPNARKNLYYLRCSV